MWLVGIAAITGNLPFQIKNGDFIVGRTKSAQIVLAERTVSRKHALLRYDGNRLVVKDLESSNGTFINEVQVQDGQITLGDHVRFGSVPCAVSAVHVFLGSIAENESTYQIPLSKAREDAGLNNAFTPAQLRIIPLLMKGKSERQIADILGKSSHTIHNQVRAMFERAGVHSREELIVRLLDRE